jgi:hypothetical protein
VDLEAALLFADLPFYNFPYAFGLLFGVGLYAIYQQRGPAFVPDYVKICWLPPVKTPPPTWPPALGSISARRISGLPA